MNSYDEIVVGGSLEALMYALIHDLPVLYINLRPPFEYDYFQSGVAFDYLKIASPIVLKAASGTTIYGPSKVQVWQRVLFLLSLAGKVLYGDNVRSISVKGNKLVVNHLRTKGELLDFKKLVVFDDEGIVGLPELVEQRVFKNIVYDWVNMNSGGSHDYDLLAGEGDFVNMIHFYPSRRSNNSRFKDLVCVSYMTDEELNDFSYSDTYVKFKLLALFKKLGLRGARNGRDHERPGHYKYYAVKVEPASREIVKQVKNTYSCDERFIFNNEEIGDIIKHPPQLNAYVKKMCDYL
jgi:hypothetical protein